MSDMNLPFIGQKVVILNLSKPQERKVKWIITTLGGLVRNAVTSQTNCIIVDECKNVINDPKFIKATQLIDSGVDITIVEYEQFINSYYHEAETIANAKRNEERSLEFQIEDHVLVKYNGTSQDVVVPVDVIEIGEEAFAHSNLKRIVLGQNCKVINNSAFKRCRQLKEIVFNDSLSRIGFSAFIDCHLLEAISIPDSVIEIDDYAFSNCSHLRYARISLKIETIGENVFYNCNMLKNPILPETYRYKKPFVFKIADKILTYETENGYVRSVLERPFLPRMRFTIIDVLEIPSEYQGLPIHVIDLKNSEFWHINKLIISKNIKTVLIGEKSLSRSTETVEIDSSNECFSIENGLLLDKHKTVVHSLIESDIKELTVPASVKIIAANAFAFSNVETIRFISRIDDIRSKAFYSSQLRTIEGIDKIENCAVDAFDITPFIRKVSDENLIIGKTLFRMNNSGKIIKVPESVQIIRKSVFRDYKSPEEIILPRTIQTIATGAFCEFENVKSISIPDANNRYKTINGILYSKDMSELVYVPSKVRERKLTVPSSVKMIHKNAIYNNDTIEEIVFSEIIQTFESGCISRCNQLKKVVFFAAQEELIATRSKSVEPWEMTSIFSDCPLLHSLDLPKNIKIIGEGSFRDCGLHSVDLPKSLIEISSYAFYNNFITEVSLPKSLRKIGESIFYGRIKRITLYDTIEPEAQDLSWEDGYEQCQHILHSNIGRLGVPSFIIGSRTQSESKWDDYEVDVLSAETDKLKYKVIMPSFRHSKEYFEYASSWLNNANFDFEKIDAGFLFLNENKIPYIIGRLLNPYHLSEQNKEQMLSYIRSHSNIIFKYLIENKMSNELRAIIQQHGLLNKFSLAYCIEISGNNTEMKEYFSSIESNQLANMISNIPKGFRVVQVNEFSIYTAIHLNDVSFLPIVCKGHSTEIAKLRDFCEQYHLIYTERCNLNSSDELKEIIVHADKYTESIVHDFSCLKVTGFYEDYSDASVNVFYSECGYPYITHTCFAGYYDPRSDGGNGRWASENNVLNNIHIRYTYIQTGDLQKVDYEFPFASFWDENKCFVENYGIMFVKDISKTS